MAAEVFFVNELENGGGIEHCSALVRASVASIEPFDTSTYCVYPEEEPNSLTIDELPEFLHEMRESFPQHFAMTVSDAEMKQGLAKVVSLAGFNARGRSCLRPCSSTSVDSVQLAGLRPLRFKATKIEEEQGGVLGT